MKKDTRISWSDLLHHRKILGVYRTFRSNSWHRYENYELQTEKEVTNE